MNIPSQHEGRCFQGKGKVRVPNPFNCVCTLHQLVLTFISCLHIWCTRYFGTDLRGTSKKLAMTALVILTCASESAPVISFLVLSHYINFRCTCTFVLLHQLPSMFDLIKSLIPHSERQIHSCLHVRAPNSLMLACIFSDSSQLGTLAYIILWLAIILMFYLTVYLLAGVSTNARCSFGHYHK